MKHEIFSTFISLVAKRTPRTNLTIICEVRLGTRPWKLVRLDDISEQGFRIAWLPNYDAALPLQIRIPGLQVLKAEVRWQEGNAFGCKFTTLLHVAVLDHIVRQAVTDGPLSR